MPTNGLLKYVFGQKPKGIYSGTRSEAPVSTFVNVSTGGNPYEVVPREVKAREAMKAILFNNGRLNNNTPKDDSLQSKRVDTLIANFGNPIVPKNSSLDRSYYNPIANSINLSNDAWEDPEEILHEYSHSTQKRRISPSEVIPTIKNLIGSLIPKIADSIDSDEIYRMVGSDENNAIQSAKKMNDYLMQNENSKPMSFEELKNYLDSVNYNRSK